MLKDEQTAVVEAADAAMANVLLPTYKQIIYALGSMVRAAQNPGSPDAGCALECATRLLADAAEAIPPLGQIPTLPGVLPPMDERCPETSGNVLTRIQTNGLEEWSVGFLEWGSSCWFALGGSDEIKPVEWFPLPAAGTGHKVAA